MIPIVRIAIALNLIQEFRDALEKNNNVYTGAMIPNIMSLTDILTLSDELLISQKLPLHLFPTLDQVQALENMHAGRK